MDTPAKPAKGGREGTTATFAHYRAMHDACAEILDESCRDENGAALTAAHAAIVDFEAWASILEPRAEAPMFVSAVREYQHSLLSLSLGHYRQAFAELRVFLELSIGAVYFSTNELLLREWLLGLRDNNWRRSTKKSGSVFARRFAKAFAPSLESEVEFYGGIAAAAYRECSEFVHANASRATPQALVFNQDLYNSWHEVAASIRLVVVFALCVRYLDGASDAAKGKVEASVMEQLGHIREVRILFGSGAT